MHWDYTEHCITGIWLRHYSWRSSVSYICVLYANVPLVSQNGGAMCLLYKTVNYMISFILFAAPFGRAGAPGESLQMPFNQLEGLSLPLS